MGFDDAPPMPVRICFVALVLDLVYSLFIVVTRLHVVFVVQDFDDVPPMPAADFSPMPQPDISLDVNVWPPCSYKSPNLSTVLVLERRSYFFSVFLASLSIATSERAAGKPLSLDDEAPSQALRAPSSWSTRYAA